MNRLLIYALIAAAGAGAVLWYGESREQDGYNRAVAEHSQAVAEWHAAQKAAYEAALSIERERAASLESDLSILRGDFAALQSEVSHVQVVKPVREDNAVCAGYNPLGPDFAVMYNRGARGALGTSETHADAGDGEMP